MLLLLLACKPDPVDSSPAARAPAWEDPDGASIVVEDDGAIVLADGRRLTFSLGFVDDPDETVNYDPWNLIDPALSFAEPDGLRFHEVTKATWGDGYTLSLEDGRAATLTVDDTGPGIRLQLTQKEGEPWAPYVRARVEARAGEAFYGLGEWFDGSEHRGHAHPMQIELQTELESGYNEAHVPIPLLVSSDGWGVLAHSDLPGAFDVAASDPDVVEITYDQLDGFVLDVYQPGRPREVVARYHQRTGMPTMPPDWAFAPLQWRDDDIHDTELVADSTAIRELGIPGGCVWVDNPWQTTYNSMQPDPARFQDWDALIASLEAKGFRMLAWTTPYVEEADPDYATYEANGWFVDAPILFSDFGEWVDLSHPDAMAAWQARVAAATARGVHGWKLDYGEDAQLGYGAARAVYAFANGEDERTMHHRYAELYHRAYAEPDPEAFLLGRAGVVGDQVWQDAIWPGDLDSGWQAFGEDGHVGGLKSAIRGGTGLAASGFPFYASDTGGYRHERPSHELMVRWTEYSALLPIMQYGGSGRDHNPWNFEPEGDSQFTQETLDAFLRYAVLHIRLFPYFRMLAERATTEGLPIVMAQGFAHPEEGVFADPDFLVGDDIFVAPVEDPGVTSRTVTLPPGAWVHWWTGAEHEGTVEIDAPLGEGPLFQRAGSAIPLLRRSVVTLASTDGTVDSWADDPGALNARVVPGEGAGFALSTGEAIDGLTLVDGDLYEGWDVEVWSPGATAVSKDGAALPAGEDGCGECWIAGDPWVRVVTATGGTLTLE
ncbi:MAG: glycoside hydrolase family 31 protein [Myxococcota bacterium]